MKDKSVEKQEKKLLFPAGSLATLFINSSLQKGKTVKIPSLGIEIKPEKVIIPSDE